MYLFIYLLNTYSPVNRTGSPQGFSQVHIKHKLNTITIQNIIKNKKHPHLYMQIMHTHTHTHTHVHAHTHTHTPACSCTSKHLHDKMTNTHTHKHNNSHATHMHKTITSGFVLNFEVSVALSLTQVRCQYLTKIKSFPYRRNTTKARRNSSAERYYKWRLCMRQVFYLSTSQPLFLKWAITGNSFSIAIYTLDVQALNLFIFVCTLCRPERG